MQENFKHQFFLPLKCNFLANLRDGEPFALGLGQGGEGGGPDFEGLGSGLLAGLDARLVVGVDAEEVGVQADRSFEERDQHAHGTGVHLIDGDSNISSAAAGKGFAGAEKEGLEIVARGDARLHFKGAAFAVLQDFDEDGEKVIHTIAKLLHVGVLIGRAFVAVDGQALEDFATLEVELLAE